MFKRIASELFRFYDDIEDIILPLSDAGTQ